MKKFTTFTALALAALSLTACGPSPKKVCEHTKELIGEGAEDMDIDTCVKALEKQKEMKGSIEFNKEAKCVMKADSLEEMAKCDSKD